MHKGLSRTTKNILIICAFLLAVNVLFGTVLVLQSASMMRSQIEKRMLDISNTAAAMLDGDALACVTADETTPEYQSVYKTLSYYQENMDLAYIYCLREISTEHFVFTVDPSDDPALFGEPIVTTDELIAASRGTPSMDKESYTDRWGKFYSAYSPVYASDGSMAGLVAVDFSAPQYEQQIREQVWTMVMIGCVSLLFGAVIVAILAARYRKSFRAMMDEMNAMSEGIETLVHEIAPGASPNPHAVHGEETTNDEFIDLGNRIHSLEQELSEQIEFVRSQAYVDGLTGLSNRSAYEERVKRLDDEIKEGQASFALALFDMNGLKEINDRFGHEQGDKAICRVADTLRRTFGTAPIFRIGGDEFLVLLDTPLSDEKTTLESVNKTLEPVTSVAKGYAVFDPESDKGYRVVFNRADSALYADKREYYKTHEDRRFHLTHEE